MSSAFQLRPDFVFVDYVFLALTDLRSCHGVARPGLTARMRPIVFSLMISGHDGTEEDLMIQNSLPL